MAPADRLDLFPGLQLQPRLEPKVRTPSHPVWTENKARLIERYLYYFVLVTHHGSYIDAFAGPQKPEKPDTWAAKLVIESEPPWLRHFYLFDQDAAKVSLLKELAAKQSGRDIRVYQGDSNKRIPDLLASGCITEKEATFCLLDQRTFECEWATVRALAQHKKLGMKIELFYFLANHWLERALAAVKKEGAGRVTAWWGRDDWQQLRGMKSWDRAGLVCERFRKDLGYATVKPWAIYSRQKGGRIMYFMIHAADHHQSPELMARAYEGAVRPAEALAQLALELGLQERAP